MASPYGRAVVIVNPRSGRGRVGAEMDELERRMQAGRLEYRFVKTTGPGDATRAAREALEGEERFVVAVGGDGTVQEVVNGMIVDDKPVAEDAVLGVVAAGSGCDFVRTFGLPGQVQTAVRHLLGERAYPIDVAKVTYHVDGEERVRYVPNIAEAGLGAATVARAARLPRFLGRSRYFFGFWLAVRKYKAANMEIHADKREFSGRANNVVVANCQYYGGGMKISPRSYPSDGILDVQVSTGPKSEAFTLLPKIYRGEHVPHPHIKEMKGKVITVDADRPLPVEGDGEVLGTTPARFEVLHEIIRLKM